MRHKDEVPHRVIVGRDIVKRMVVDRRVGGDLPELSSGLFVAKDLRLG